MAKSFEETVNEVIKSSIDAEGNLNIPEDIDEPVRFAVMAEKRRRDTQTAFNSERQKNIAYTEELNHYRSQAEQNVLNSIPQEQRDELEELKHSDPEAWRSKLNEIEQANVEAFKTQVEEVSNKAKTKSEAVRRQELLQEWVENNPDLELNDETIEDNIPPKYVKQLEKGEITFEDFLSTAKRFLSKGKVVAPGEEKAPESPDLSKTGGNHMPGGKPSPVSTYEDEVF